MNKVYPVIRTGDGVVDGPIKNADRIESIGTGSDGIEHFVRLAEVPLSWHKSQLDTSRIPFDYLVANRNRLSQIKDQVRIHIRSCNARAAQLDGELRELYTLKGHLTALIEARFYLQRILSNGRIVHPAFESLRDNKSKMSIPLLHMFVVPEGNQPLTPDEIQEGVDRGTHVFPLGYRVDENGMMEIPLHDRFRFDPDVANDFTPEQWRRFWVDGKRFLHTKQPPIDISQKSADYLEFPYAVRPFQMQIPSGQVFFLDKQTSHSDVQLVASPGIEMHGINPAIGSIPHHMRHAELLPRSPGISANTVKVRGQIFRIFDSSHTPAVSVSVPPISFLEKPFQGLSLEEAVRHSSSDVSDVIRILEKMEGLDGIVVRPNGIVLLPYVSKGSIAGEVNYAARTGERGRGALPEIFTHLEASLSEHPGIVALQQSLRSSTSHHLLRNALISRTLPTPAEMEQVIETGTIAHFASNLTATDTDDLNDRFAVDIHTLEHLHRLHEEGNAMIHWLSPDKKLRQLHGLSFVDVNRLPDFRKISSATSFYLTFKEGVTKALVQQLPGYIESMLQVLPPGERLAFSNGASTGGMLRVQEIVSRYPEVLSMGAANLLPGQTPNFAFDGITLFNNLRYRQALMAWFCDMFTILPGGRGTTAEIADTIVDMTVKDSVPGPVALTDPLTRQRLPHFYANFVKQYQHSSSFPKGDAPFTSPWISKLFKKTRSLHETFTLQQEFRSDPVEWWKNHAVPDAILPEALQRHVRFTKKTGRQPAYYLESAFEHFGVHSETGERTK